MGVLATLAGATLGALAVEGRMADLAAMDSDLDNLVTGAIWMDSMLLSCSLEAKAVPVSQKK